MPMRLARTSFRALTLVAAVASVSLGISAQAQLPSKATASAIIIDAGGHKIGDVKLADTPNGLTIKGSVSGLPAGMHGIHIHAVGKCDQPDFTTAGAHFNPTNMQHGSKNPKGPHLGDLQNIRIVADEQGVQGAIEAKGSGSINLTDKGVTLTGTNGILGPDGAAIVIHAAQDDYMTDPSGNSGARIACGIIILDTKGGK
jgi:superoxide dismutase, Cu-Zn family